MTFDGNISLLEKLRSMKTRRLSIKSAIDRLIENPLHSININIKGHYQSKGLNYHRIGGRGRGANDGDRAFQRHIGSLGGGCQCYKSYGGCGRRSINRGPLH